MAMQRQEISMKRYIRWILYAMMLFALSYSTIALSLVEQQTNHTSGSGGINTYSGTLADAVRFIANESYYICGYKYKFSTCGGLYVNMTLWTASATGNPTALVHTFTTSTNNCSGNYIYYVTNSCYKLTKNNYYFLATARVSGDTTTQSQGISTGATNGLVYANSAYNWLGGLEAFGVGYATYGYMDTPTISVNWNGNSPQNNSYNDNVSLNYYFNFTANPTSTIANCSLYWNGTLQNTQYNLNHNTTYNISVTKPYPLNANITSYISCVGNNSVSANSTTKYIYWNLTKTLNVNWDGQSPVNYFYNTNSSLRHYFNISGNNLSTANCSLYWNGSNIATTNGVVTGENWYLEAERASPLYINATTYINCTSDFVPQSLSSTKYIEWNLTSPSVVLQDKSPDDITSTSGFAQTILFNYTYSYFGTNNEKLLAGSQIFYYKLNDSSNSCLTYLNGSYYNCGYQSNNYFANISNSLYRFMLTDNDILPASYNINETYMEGFLHGTRDLTSNNQYYRIELLNISNSTRYGFFEVMLNITSGTESPIQVYYCNSTYITGGNILSSPYCVQFGTIATPYSYNHSHGIFSKHHLVPMSIINGSLYGIKVTSSSYFIIRGINTKTVSVYTIPGYVRPNAMATSGNNGISWTEDSTTVADSHVHQFNSDATLYYFAQGYHTDDHIFYNSSILYDVLDLGSLPPNSPVINHPIEYTLYNGIININYTFGTSPMGLSVIYSNISLRNVIDDSWNYTIVANNTPYSNYSWNSALVKDGTYNIRVYNCDSTMVCSFAEINNIIIDNIPPTINYTSNTTSSGGKSQTWINGEIVTNDIHGTTSTINLYDSTFNLVSSNTSINNTLHNYNFTGLSNGVYYLNATSYDQAGNINQTSTRNITIDTVLPVITINNPNISTTPHIRNNTAFNWNITLSDANIFAMEINCSLNGVTQYYRLINDINATSFNYTNQTYFTQPGLYNCNLTASDDHTNNIFNVNYTKEDYVGEILKIDEGLSTLTKGKIGDINYEVDKSSIDITTNIIQKNDRISFEFNIIPKTEEVLDKGGKVIIKQAVQEVPISFKCNAPFKAYKRNSDAKYIEHWVCSDGVTGYWIDGNTKEQGIDVSSYYDTNTEEIKYLYKTSGDKVTMESIGGLNFNTVLFNISVDWWQNTTFYAYNRWNGSNISVFNVTITNSTATTTYSTTTGNVTISLANDTYTVQQQALGYYFGNLSSSYTIRSTAIYNTAFWQSELSVKLVEGVLGDNVTDASIWTNVSNPLYQNNTGTVPTGFITYYSNAGNYSIYANKSSGEFVPSNLSSTGVITLGEQRTVQLNFSRIYYASLFREQTNEPFNFTESNTSQVEVKLEIICQDKDIIFNLNESTTTLYGIDCDWTAATNPNAGWFLTVNYPESDVNYYRYVMPYSSISNNSIWLLEVQSGDVAVEHEVSLTDLANNYDEGFIYVETNIPTVGYQEVIRQKLNMLKKVNLFLQENEQYRHYAVDNEGNIKNLGSFVAKTAESTVVQPDIEIGSNYSSQSDIFNVIHFVKDGYLYVNITTLNNEAIDEIMFELLTYNVSNGMNYTDAILYGDYLTTTVYNFSGSGAASYSFNQSIDPNLAYIYNLFGKQDLGGDNKISYWNSTQVVTAPSTYIFEGFENVSSDIKLWVATGAVIGTIMIGTVTSIEIVFFIALVEVGAFISYGWFEPINGASKIAHYGKLSIIAIICAVLLVFMMLRKMKKDTN